MKTFEIIGAIFSGVWTFICIVAVLSYDASCWTYGKYMDWKESRKQKVRKQKVGKNMLVLKIAFLFMAILFTCVNLTKTSLKNDVPVSNLLLQAVGITGFIVMQWVLVK